MLISKFDLYKHEWLELVFENRNKSYGAYYLRQHYAGNMVRAMGFTFFVLALLCGASIVFKTTSPIIHVTVVNETPPIVPHAPIEPKKEDPIPKKQLKSDPPAPRAATHKFVPPVVVVDKLVTEQPKENNKLGNNIGPTETKGKEGGNTTPVETTGSGPAIQPVDKEIHTTGELDFMPEPIGGEGAWAKFLNRNLRYPPPAQEEGANGKVMLSFVVEKDGRLSDITVINKAGHGFDEEALRVLKLAKAWKPGLQHGQPVRVRYYIPINFQLSE
jgi:protein TonB